MYTEFEIESVGSFIETVKPRTELRPNALPFLFRGQEDFRKRGNLWRLLPQLARGRWSKNNRRQTAKGLLDSEGRMLERFKSTARMHIRYSPRYNVEWLVVARHYGLPTHLLDWTTNPLIGLWFAVRRRADAKETPVVWALRINDAQCVVKSSADLELRQTGKTLFFEAPPIDERPLVQSSWLSLHSFNRSKNKFVALEDQLPSESGFDLFRFRLKTNPWQLREELHSLGIAASSVFPGLGGICEAFGMEHVPFCMP